MYRTEVPLYGTLVELVERINTQVLAQDPALAAQLLRNDERARLDEERHGAIRVGTPQELATLRRLFAVMGMYPVAYYDLSVAGVPVHSTAFRPLTGAALAQNPFRVFTSLLRLELIDNPQYEFTVTPKNTYKLADFLYRVGAIKHKPQSWKDYFFQDERPLQGS